jgi:hypothetical protein
LGAGSAAGPGGGGSAVSGAGAGVAEGAALPARVVAAADAGVAGAADLATSRLGAADWHNTAGETSKSRTAVVVTLLGIGGAPRNRSHMQICCFG